MLAAISIASESILGIEKIDDVVTFVRDDGKPLYCYTPEFSVDAYVSTAFPREALPSIVRNLRSLRTQQSQTSAKLLTRSLVEQGDPLLAFLSAWWGIEIFVNQNFSYYEKHPAGATCRTDSATRAQANDRTLPESDER